MIDLEEQGQDNNTLPGLHPYNGQPWLSVVLPAHNEAPHIAQVATSFLEAALSLGREAEVIVVDDASDDETAAQVTQAAQHWPQRLRLVQRPTCGGYGSALRTGFEAARGEWIFFTDSDGQFLADDLPDFLHNLGEPGTEMILGYRHPRRDLHHRKAMGKLWTAMMRTCFRVHVRDMNCAYKAFRRQDMDHMDLQSQGALINAELLHKARRMGLRHTQRPVRHLPRQAGEASGANPAVIARALWELARYRLSSL